MRKLLAIAFAIGILSACSEAGTITLYGCRGYVGPDGSVQCIGQCNHVCARIEKDVYVGSPYPDNLTTFDFGVQTFQSECLLLYVNEDGTVAYVALP
jgi:hypothetical protein